MDETVQKNKKILHGILNVYKEQGYTSHDVVAKLRGMTHQKKIGHTGTLDPDAEGVLPVCLGKGTKVCSLLTDQDKTYETVLLLGKATDTQDISGEVVAKGDSSLLQAEQVRKVIQGFVGGYDQVPPMYSALKVNGQKLYELARAGREVERDARRVEISRIEILEMELPRVHMRVTCSKGTYIRTLCHDIGERLGCHGCMEALKRIRVGQFYIEDSKTLSQIQEIQEEGSLKDFLIPVDALFPGYSKAAVRREWEKTARNGGTLPKNAVYCETESCDRACIRLYDEEGNFIALYQWEEASEEYRIRKMFFPE